jgi:hypothetical protein
MAPNYCVGALPGLATQFRIVIHLSSSYTAVLAAYCEVDEPPALMVRTS